jgi:hypothetical protein
VSSYRRLLFQATPWPDCHLTVMLAAIVPAERTNCIAQQIGRAARRNAANGTAVNPEVGWSALQHLAGMKLPREIDDDERSPQRAFPVHRQLCAIHPCRGRPQQGRSRPLPRLLRRVPAKRQGAPLRAAIARKHEVRHLLRPLEELGRVRRSRRAANGLHLHPLRSGGQ